MPFVEVLFEPRPGLHEVSDVMVITPTVGREIRLEPAEVRWIEPGDLAVLEVHSRVDHGSPGPGPTGPRAASRRA